MRLDDFISIQDHFLHLKTTRSYTKRRGGITKDSFYEYSLGEGDTVVVSGHCYLSVKRGSVICNGIRIASTSRFGKRQRVFSSIAEPLTVITGGSLLDVADQYVDAGKRFYNILLFEKGNEIWNDMVLYYGVEDIWGKRLEGLDGVTKVFEGFYIMKIHSQIFSDSKVGLIHMKTDSKWEGFYRDIYKHHHRKKEKVSSVVIVGQYGLDKSSFCKFVANKEIEGHGNVMFMDLDPTESEVSPTSVISLHVLDKLLFGPSFTRIQDGEVISKSVICTNIIDPVLYLSCVHEIVKKCRDFILSDECSSRLLVINLPGYNMSFGKEVIEEIIDRVNPRHLVNIDHIYNIDMKEKPIVHLVKGYGRKNAKFEKGIKRLILLSYMGGFCNENVDVERTGDNNGQQPFVPVEMQKPREVCIYDKPAALYTIHSRIVALYEKNDNGVKIFHGLGFIKSVNHKYRKIYVITPIRDIERVNSVECTDISLPFSVSSYYTCIGFEGSECIDRKVRRVDGYDTTIPDGSVDSLM